MTHPLLAKYGISPQEFAEIATDDPYYIDLFVLAATTFLEPLDPLTPTSLTQAYTLLNNTYNKLNQTLPETVNFAGLGISHLACKKGCSYCCSLRITTTPVEALTIAHHLKVNSTPEQLQEVIKELEIYTKHQNTLSPKQTILDTTPCPFLVDSLCSIYSIRPATCNNYHSFSLESCERDARRDPNAVVPQDPYRTQLIGVFMIALEICLNRLKLPYQELEFVPALQIALSNPAAAEDYLRGKNPFQSAERLDIQDAQAQLFLEKSRRISNLPLANQ